MLRAHIPPSSVDRAGYVTPADLDHTHPHHHQDHLFAWLTAKSLPGPRRPKIANQPAQLALPFEAYHPGWRHPSILRVALSFMGSDWRTVSAAAIDGSRRDDARAYFVAVATTQCKPMCAMPVSILRGYARGTMTEAAARRAQVEPSLTTAESDTGAAADRRSSRRDHPRVESAHAARPHIAGHVRRAVSIRVVSRTHPAAVSPAFSSLD